MDSHLKSAEVSELTEEPEEKQKGIIISIMNHKGGVGKSTTTINLGAALAKLEKRVCIVDFDAQCNSSDTLLGKAKLDRSSACLYHILDPEAPDFEVSQAIHPSQFPGVMCLPNSEDTTSLEPEIMARAPESHFAFRTKCRQYFQEHFDYILIDNPPNIGTFVIISLYASDFAIVPTESGSTYSTRGLFKAIKFINRIRDAGNSDLKFLRLLVTKIDRRTNEARATTAFLQKTFPPDEIFQTAVPSCSGFKQAERLKTSIFKVSGAREGMKAYMAVAQELDALFNKA